MIAPQLLTVSEVAARLVCSEANVYALLEKGDLPFVRIGRSKGYRIDEGDLVEFVEARKHRKQAPSRLMARRPKLKHIRF